jgi:hypothetical protein
MNTVPASFKLRWTLVSQSQLTLVPGFEIQFPHLKPNWWWRLWQFVFFGWRWRNL